jgi:small subunit ribosomal protein S11
MADEKKSPIAPRRAGKRVRRVVPEGHAYIKAGYNNTLISLTDPAGQVLAWHSSGSSGFKGTKKSTPYAAQVAAEAVGEKAKAYGLEALDVYVTGAGPGREQALRALAKSFTLNLIVDRTPVPHNGCRRKKARRV